MRLLAVKLVISWFLFLFQATGYAGQSKDCDSPIQSDLLECLSGRYEAADVELNAAYTKLMSSLDVDQANQLRTTQRRWMTFRDEVCELAYEEAFPGREAPLDRLICLEQKSLLRTRLLQESMPPFAGAGRTLEDLGIEPEALILGLGASSRGAVASWLRYMDAHCTEARIAGAYQSKALCLINHRLVDK